MVQQRMAKYKVTILKMGTLNGEKSNMTMGRNFGITTEIPMFSVAVEGNGHKIILDALVDLGVLIDDGRKYVAGFTDRFFTDKDDPRIEITIEEQAQ